MVVNVSRSLIDVARQRLAPVRVLQIKAARELLAARLRARARESDDDILTRLDRAEAFTIGGDDVRLIVNGGPLDQAVREFVRVLDEERLLVPAASAGVSGHQPGPKG